MTSSEISACRKSAEEIVVSEPVAESLNANTTVKKDMSFTFPNPIPIEATDSFLLKVRLYEGWA